MKHIMLTLILLTCVVSSSMAGDYEVASLNLSVRLSSQGEIVSVKAALKPHDFALQGATRLENCRPAGDAAVARLDGGGIEFHKPLVHTPTGRRLQLIERFRPTSDSIRWEIEIVGDGEPWTTTIATRLSRAVALKDRFWTAWSDPEQRSDGWRDPLVPMPFATRAWSYRGDRLCGTNISLPLASILEPETDAGLSLALSPEDVLLNLSLRTTESGEIEFLRTRHRLGGGRPVRFAMDLTAHEADWRGGVRWMYNLYRPYFEPPNPKAAEMAGCGAYSADERQIDVEKFKRMAFRVNWKCSEDFPYMGMFLPPVADENERWTRDQEAPPIVGKPPYNTLKSLNNHCRRVKADGFFILSYFNATEFGKEIRHPPPPRKELDERDLWKDANDFLYEKLAAAILMTDGRPIRSWHGSVAMDPSEPCFRRHLLQQARRHIDHQPDSFGLCIDRLDWLDRYNPDRDDGVSWVDGRPARSLYLSWRGLMSELGPLMHSAGKVIFVNCLRTRLELFNQVDGFYCEFGDGPSLNSCAIIGLAKPVMMWTDSEDSLRPDPDAFFQRHLHMGAYPTAPYPGNHHCINPSEFADGQYLDYGPLLDAMRGKRWVFSPRPVEVLGRKPPKLNAFAVPDGYALPVTFGGRHQSVRLAIRNLPGVSVKSVFTALHPGVAQPIKLHPTADGDAILLDVPLRRGCAMVRVRTTADKDINAESNMESAAKVDASPRRTILTPKPPPTPRINGPRVFGVRPGRPVLFTIPATGRRPMTFAADNLPDGLRVDPNNGQISGSIKDRGEYAITLRAKNELGENTRVLKIVCDERIALTPHMGWSAWYYWTAQATDKTIREAADAMVATGLIDHGYSYLCIDDAWGRKPGSKGPILGGAPRDDNGDILPNGNYPDMKSLTDYIHAKGLKAGIYTSPGPQTCAGRTGSLGHEEQDARQFARWGFDYVKYDWCSYKTIVQNPDLEAMQAPYRNMGRAVAQQDRDMVFNLCQYGMGDVWRWGRAVGGHSWRTGGDFGFPLESMPQRLYNDVFALYGKNELQIHSGPGGWNDPDYLLLGQLTDWKGGSMPTPLTPNEQYSHVSLWCLLAAPLIFSCDIARLDAFTLGLLGNDEVIEVNQDPLGQAALRLAKQGDLEVWAKDMEDGSKAVGLFNCGPRPANVTAGWSDLGVSGKQAVRDLWRQRDLGVYEDRFTAPVDPHGVALVRLWPTAAENAPSQEALRTQFFKLCELSMAEMEKPLVPFFEKYRKHEDPTTRHYPFFMDSYAIRPLCVAYDMTGEQKYLDACTRWANQIVEFQRRMTPKGAYYLNYGAFRRPGQDRGQWFTADSGSIAAAILAVAVRTKDAQQRETYLASIRDYARLTIDNYVSVGSGVTDGLWTYKGEWWASTAIFGTFMFLAHAETKDPEYLKVGLGCIDWLNKCDFPKGNPPAVDAAKPGVIFYCGECYALALPHLEKGSPRRAKAEAQLAIIQKWLAENQKGRGAKTEWNYFDMGKVYMPGNPYFMYLLARQSPQYRDLAAEADREMEYVGDLLFKDGRPPRSTDLEYWGLITFGMMSYAERLNPGGLTRVGE